MKISYKMILIMVVMIFFSLDFLSFAEEQGSAIDIFNLSLEELMEIEVEVASMFLEDERVVGSSVSSVTPAKWKRPWAWCPNQR